MPGDENQDSFVMSTDDQPAPKAIRSVEPAAPVKTASQEKSEAAVNMLQSEKRLVDLELSIAELKQNLDRFKDVDSSALNNLAEMPDLKQRVEDLEDLVMVESAGIEELKDIMEAVRDRMQSEAQGQTVSPAVAGQMQANIGAVDQMRAQIESLAREVAMMKELAASPATAGNQTGNVQLFSAKLDNLKTTLDELIKRKVEVDIRIERLDKTVAGLQTKAADSTPEGLKKQLDTLNRNFSVVDSRMDAIETVSKNITEELTKVRSATQKFESFERASNLAKELQSRMEEFKFIENEVKRVSNRVEGFYENLNERLDKIREFEKIVPEMKGALEKMRDEVMKRFDEDKISILDRATKDEASSIRDRLSQVESKVSGARFDDLQKEIEGLKEEVRNSLSEARQPMSVINIEISDIMSRMIALETRIGGLERVMQTAGRAHPIVLE